MPAPVWTEDFRVSVVEYGSSIVEAISRGQLDLQSQVKKVRQTRKPTASVATLELVDPLGSFSTYNIRQALDVFPLAGLCMEEPGDDFAMYVETQDCVGPKANAAIKYTISQGIVAPQTLSITHLGDAELTYSVNAKYDGTNAPVAIQQGQGNPAVTAASDTRYTMDRMFIVDPANAANNVNVYGKIEIELAFNSEVNGRGADSTLANTVQTLDNQFQVLTVRGYQLSWYRDNVTPGAADTEPSVVDNIHLGRDLTDDTSPAATRNITMYLKDRNKAVGDSAHIEIQLRGLLVGDQVLSGAPDSPAECSFQLHLVEEGAVAPIIVTSGLVAIPA